VHAEVDRLRRATESLTAEGTRVRHLGSAFVPDQALCLHHVDAHLAATVGEASRRAAIEPARTPLLKCEGYAALAPSRCSYRRFADHELINLGVL
jgi:hypothetical protein